MNIWRFPKLGTIPNHPSLVGFSMKNHDKPSILGYLHLWKTSFRSKLGLSLLSMPWEELDDQHASAVELGEQYREHQMLYSGLERCSILVAI